MYVCNMYVLYVCVYGAVLTACCLTFLAVRSCSLCSFLNCLKSCMYAHLDYPQNPAFYCSSTKWSAIYMYIFQTHLITTRTPENLNIHELAVTAQQLASVAQLVGALHQNRRFNSCQRSSVAFFASVPG